MDLLHFKVFNKNICIIEKKKCKLKVSMEHEWSNGRVWLRSENFSGCYCSHKNSLTQINDISDTVIRLNDLLIQILFEL